MLGINATEEDVAIGYGRFRTTLSIASRAGYRSRAIGTNCDAAQRIEACDGAASGTDFYHVDDRNADGNAAAF